jgi:hypothetical protein
VYTLEKGDLAGGYRALLAAMFRVSYGTAGQICKKYKTMRKLYEAFECDPDPESMLIGTKVHCVAILALYIFESRAALRQQWQVA